MRTLLLDDHQIFIDGLCQLLSHLKTIEVVHKISDPIRALELIQRDEIELVITDLSMPIMDGNTFIAELKKVAPLCKILVLSMHMDVPTIRKTIYQDVDGFLFKDSDFKQLSDAVTALQNKKKFFDSRVSEALISSLNEQPKKPVEVDLVDSLTDREREILVMLSKEMTQVEIADRLHLSMSTVVYHKRKLMALFDVKSTAGLIRLATQSGLVD